MAIDIDELKRLLERATPLPWGPPKGSAGPDGDFMIAAVNALPSLLAQADRAEDLAASSADLLNLAYAGLTELETEVAAQAEEIARLEAENQRLHGELDGLIYVEERATPAPGAQVQPGAGDGGACTCSPATGEICAWCAGGGR